MPSSRDHALDQLLVQNELRTLTLRYARAVDRRDYETLGELFVEDGAIHVHRGDPLTTEPYLSLEGRAAIIELMQRIEEWEKTQHHLSNQLFESDGEQATGESYCMAHHVSTLDGVPHDFTMAIRYQDRFVKDGDRWWFATRRLWVDWERDAPLGERGWS